MNRSMFSTTSEPWALFSWPVSSPTALDQDERQSASPSWLRQALAFSRFLCISLLQDLLWPLCVLACVLTGMWYAWASLTAEAMALKAYQPGNTMYQGVHLLMAAADRFPLYHGMRYAPSYIVMRSFIFVPPDEALMVLDRTLKYDPNAKDVIQARVLNQALQDGSLQIVLTDSEGKAITP